MIPPPWSASERNGGGTGHRYESGAAELEGLGPRRGQKLDVAGEGVGLPMKLQCRVVGDHSVGGETAREDIRIDRDAIGGLSPGHHRIDASPDSQQVARLQVLLHRRQAGTGLQLPIRLMRAREVLQPKDLVR
jgi:hypothetical protein